MKLTARQAEILEYIRGFFRDAGFSPTCGEIQRHFGFGSPATVTSHLDLLEKKGVIRRAAGVSRNIELSEPVPMRKIVDVPLLGTIPAGYPSAGIQEPDRYISIDAFQIPWNARTFALRVSGDSMRDAAIVEGDVVIMESCEPKDRDIVAALIDGEVTLKRYLLQKGEPFLRAENPAYPDLLPAQELVIQGVLRMVMRNLPARK